MLGDFIIRAMGAASLFWAVMLGFILWTDRKRLDTWSRWNVAGTICTIVALILVGLPMLFG